MKTWRLQWWLTSHDEMNKAVGASTPTGVRPHVHLLQSDSL